MISESSKMYSLYNPYSIHVRLAVHTSYIRMYYIPYDMN